MICILMAFSIHTSTLCPHWPPKPDVRLQWAKCLPVVWVHSCYLGECVIGYLCSAVCHQSMSHGKVKSSSKLLASGFWLV